MVSGMVKTHRQPRSRACLGLGITNPVLEDLLIAVPIWSLTELHGPSDSSLP
jgi:hypothetical protein